MPTEDPSFPQVDPLAEVPSREQLVHALYEAAELEHTLMCTYLYAAFSLRDGEAEGLSSEEAAVVAGWRKTILRVAVDEMGHLTAIWNITSALGGAPRFGRDNFPIGAGALPAGVVVRLEPFSEAVLQHFIFLERPHGSAQLDGQGFERDFKYLRGIDRPRLTPMAMDYDTVGSFYETLSTRLGLFVAHHGEAAAFCGHAGLQLSEAEVQLTGAKTVVCLKTALAAFKAIIEQGEGAPEDAAGSHYQRFLCIQREHAELKAKNPDFAPAFAAAVNPVLRRPTVAAGRVWIENEDAASTVDIANTAYMLMLRLLAYSYSVPRPLAEKSLVVDLSLGLMRAVTFLGERAARLPAGGTDVTCNAGMSFTALRDAASLPPGAGARRFFSERLHELAAAAAKLDHADPRAASAARHLDALVKRADKGFVQAGKASAAAALQQVPAGLATPAPALPTGPAAAPAPASVAAAAAGAAASAQPTAQVGLEHPAQTTVNGIETVEGRDITIIYEGKKCIHSRFCVTKTPRSFLANVVGPWIHPDATEVDALVAMAHECVSGAIRYVRKDGKHDELPPPVNLVSIREGGPYAFNAELVLDGDAIPLRATLCRCGASKNKPYCDGSHHEVGFAASGEPPTVAPTDMLPVRNGPLRIDPQLDGPYQVRGNLELLSGTGRMVSRVTSARLCRCGGSSTKPFCDNTHLKNGFRSE